MTINVNQPKNPAPNVGGKIPQEADKMTGNKPQEVKGPQEPAKIQPEKAVGDPKEAARDPKAP